MGVTIHYSFVREQMPEDLLKKAEVLAKKLGFTIEERAWNKLIINPHPDSEWICLHWHKVKTITKREGWDLEKSQIDHNFERKSDTPIDYKTHPRGILV